MGQTTTTTKTGGATRTETTKFCDVCKRKGDEAEAIQATARINVHLSWLANDGEKTDARGYKCGDGHAWPIEGGRWVEGSKSAQPHCFEVAACSTSCLHGWMFGLERLLEHCTIPPPKTT